ncbi:IS110 family transposase [Methyloglobulus sp.]|uniref:IS110 family transposase n=1 Tax=Methyloglobulus sp. TaxID=2518622 RepID=UPI00398A2D26
MTNIQLNKIDHEPKPPLFADIDVGAEELILVIRKNGKPFDPQKFANTAADRARLVKKLVKLPSLIVCLEATGIHHFDLALSLHDAGVLLMVINPKAAHNVAKVLMKNSKTDAVDADTLAEYAARMDFVAWTRPSNEKLALRSFARRVNAFVNRSESGREKPSTRAHRHSRNTESGAERRQIGYRPVGETHRPLNG